MSLINFVFLNLGKKLRRRLRNLLIVSVIAGVSIYTYRGYRRYAWFRDMNESDSSIGTKPRIVVLGTGNRFDINLQ